MSTTYIQREDGGLYCAKSGAADLLPLKSDGDAGDPATPLVLLVSTEAVDSDGDVVHQRPNKNGPGWDLKRFNGAPVISWQHDLRMPNLSGPRTRGKVDKHPTKGQGLFLNPLQFDEGDPFALLLEGKLRRDVIKESSVGFRILNRDPRKVEGQTVGYDIWGAELFEVAIANRGANPETEVMAKHLLTRADVVPEVEAAGAAAVEELKAELGHLLDEVRLLSGVLKVLGDRVDGQESAEILRADEQRAKNKAAIQSAASELLLALKANGTAYGS